MLHIMAVVKAKISKMLVLNTLKKIRILTGKEILIGDAKFLTMSLKQEKVSVKFMPMTATAGANISNKHSKFFTGLLRNTPLPVVGAFL